MPKNQPLNNKDYWAARQESLVEQLLGKGEEYFTTELVNQYDKAANSLNDEIDKFFSRFAVNNEISYADAKRILTTQERRKFQLKVDDYIKKGRTLEYSNEWAKVLENASTVYRVSRLQEIQLYMHQIIEELTAQYVPSFTSVLSSTYEDGYYLQLYELAKGTTATVRFDRVDQAYVEKLIAKPWAADGVTFSERIWTDRNKLNNYMNTRLTQGLIRGDSAASITKDMSNRMGVEQRDAGRLVMTETAYYSSAATQDAYKSYGIDEFEFLATLDRRTSKICRSMDGTIHKRSDYEIGVNAPPLHVYCRSTTIPVVSDIWGNESERAARSSNGDYYRVPANINYDEWFNEYVN